MKNMSFSRNKLNQNIIFRMQTFFNVWFAEKILIQNQTPCKFSNLKSDAFKRFHIKLSLNRFIRFLLNCYQSIANIRSQFVGKRLLHGVRKFFMIVWHLFVSYLVLSYWFICSLWQLGSWWVQWLYLLHHQLIHTNIFVIQKMVKLQRFCFKRH